MLLIRNVRRSLFEFFKGLLLSPPSGTFALPYNVYTEAQMQSANKGTFTEAEPFTYFVDRNILPMSSRIPLIVLEVTPFVKQTFELGNRAGHVFGADVNIFGRNHGERDDFASFFQDNSGLTVPVYNYYSAGSPSVGRMELLDEPTVMIPSLSMEVAEEGTLRDLSVVQYDYWLQI